MAKTEFGVNHPLAVKLFSKKLAVEAMRETFVGRFVGDDEGSLIQEFKDLKKSAGDKITYGLQVQLQGDGIMGDATLEGNEEALQHYDASIEVNQLRHATRTKGRMTEQRVPYNLRKLSLGRLRDWYAERMDVALANQLCGNTAVADTRYTGLQATIAPSTNRILRAGGVATDEALTSANGFKLGHIDVLRERAKGFSIAAGTGPVMRPIKYMGEDYYVVFLHDHQVTSMRTDVSTGQWADIQKAAMQGGDVKGNPIFTGALGVYNKTVIHEWSRITQGVHSTAGTAVADTRRAVFCGAQAAAIAFGGSNGPSSYTWNEEMFDYGNQLGVAAGSIFGLKKNKYIPADDSSTNAEDFGVIVLSTYAAASTPE